jgi:hypothetical protein
MLALVVRGQKNLAQMRWDRKKNPFSYPSIPSRVGNKNYPSFVGLALDLDHLKDGLVRELSRWTATIQIAHFQICN